MNKVFLLLGSNLGDRSYNLKRCMVLLNQYTGTIVDKSSIYETEPWGTEIPLTYLNMVVILKNELSPQKTLDSILQVEKKLGRERGSEKNLPRTVDVDILLYNNEVIDSENLKIPHERMHLRKFVLVPLAEIAADYVHPVFNQTTCELLEKCPDVSWVKLYNS